MPNSINIPLFDNDERATIGTIYKKEGRKKAVIKGLEFFENKMELLLDNLFINIDSYKNISENDYSKQLSLQIHSPVMWSETIKAILEKEINTCIEIGPKKTLLNFLPRDFQGEKYSLCNIEDINNVQ